MLAHPQIRPCNKRRQINRVVLSPRPLNRPAKSKPVLRHVGHPASPAIHVPFSGIKLGPRYRERHPNPDPKLPANLSDGVPPDHRNGQGIGYEPLRLLLQLMKHGQSPFVVSKR